MGFRKCPRVAFWGRCYLYYKLPQEKIWCTKSIFIVEFNRVAALKGYCQLVDASKYVFTCGCMVHIDSDFANAKVTDNNKLCMAIMINMRILA